MKRALILIAFMALSGLAANRALATFQTRDGTASLVSATSPQVRLPGTIFVSQDGAIYAITGSTVRRLPLPSGGSWMQPRALPDGTLLVVRRYDQYSDLYHVTAAGRVLSQMTVNAQAASNRKLQLDHWALWPAIGPDGTSVFFATDSPKPAPRTGNFEVDFSLWSAPLDARMVIGDTGITGGTRWSVPDAYTGGDIEPVPLPDGNVLYSSFVNTGKGTVVSVLGLQTGPRTAMVSLTTLAQDCGAPAVAADGVTVAMVCDRGQTADIEVATLQGTTLSAPRVVVANCLCNSPSWSPSGDNLLYMNASDPDGNFGLWYVANAGALHPAAAKRVTDASVDLDATSAASWMSR